MENRNFWSDTHMSWRKAPAHLKFQRICPRTEAMYTTFPKIGTGRVHTSISDKEAAATQRTET